MSNQTHIIIGDAHARPDISSRRFTWLGQFIVDYHKTNPTENITIIDMGDWEDMPSLSSYDKGTKSYEGRRYKRDLEAAWEARERFVSPILGYNNSQRRNKAKLFSPQMYALGGNHFEGRIKRAIECSPLLDGTIGVADGRHAEYGWDYVPFKEPLTIDGITYVHYWQANGTAQPIATGKYPGQVLLREKHCSTVVGHNHKLDIASSLAGDGRRMWGISAGCFLDPDQHEDYAGQNNKDWWKGILIIKDVKAGEIDGGIHIIPSNRLKEKYE